MTDNVKVALSKNLMEAVFNLPRSVRNKFMDFMNKFLNNPRSPGIHYEKIADGVDKKMSSVRIDDTYRGIVAHQGEAYLLLWVAHHDEAYQWARRRKCEVDPYSGMINIYDVREAGTIESTSPRQGLFSLFSDEEMKSLGVADLQLNLVRSIISQEDLYAVKDRLGAAYEALEWLTEGIPFKEVLDLVKADEEETASSAKDLASALDKPQNKQFFAVVENEEELRSILEAPLEKWRVFLHPRQRRIVEREVHGASRVIGAAGTGKTVVAMHRAKKLASKLSGREQILFTTFTRNLAADIRDNLSKICTTEEMRHIKVQNLDAWVAEFLEGNGYNMRIVYDGADSHPIRDAWEDAMTEAGAEAEFELCFYEEEWNRVIVAQEAFTLPLYAKASRTGRGTRLDRRGRMKVWKVIECYQDYMKEKGWRDINMAMYECRQLLQKTTKDAMYKHIVVDEGQDFSTNAFKLLRTLAGEEHDDDIFIVGDAHQRIYKNHAVLSRCGINVRGRSSILHVNYRTTEEIHKAAFGVLAGVSFDDLDGADADSRSISLTHGEKPVVRKFKTATAEFAYLQEKIEELTAQGVPASDICLVARTNSYVSDYAKRLQGAGIPFFELKRDAMDDREKPGVRLATMHRVKGLEFQYVFIVAANERVLPLAQAIDHTDAIAEKETETGEKCLLYVAMTRAQKGVFITCYGRGSKVLTSISV